MSAFKGKPCAAAAGGGAGMMAPSSMPGILAGVSQCSQDAELPGRTWSTSKPGFLPLCAMGETSPYSQAVLMEI